MQETEDSGNQSVIEWDASQFWNGFNKQGALILLNQPVQRSLLDLLWPVFSIHLCADGGANRLYDLVAQDEDEKQRYRLEYIVGDMDSLRPEVEQYFESKETLIYRNPCQNTTDFTKTLQVLKKIEDEQIGRPHDVLVVGALTGRFDHILSCINVLFKWQDRKMFLLSDEGMVFLLAAGSHMLHIQKSWQGPSCGLIPIGADAIVTTQGLVWNLDHTLMRFGELISTSNSIQDSIIHVETSSPLLWTIEYNYLRIKPVLV